MNVIPDLVERAPRLDSETEQILLRFLGLEPHARCNLCEKMVQVRVHLPQHLLLSDDRWLVHNGEEPVLSLDDGLLLLVRLGQIDN